MKNKYLVLVKLSLLPTLSFANEGQKIIGGLISFIGYTGFVLFTLIGLIIHKKITNLKIKIALLGFIVAGVAALILYLMNDIDYPELLTGMLMVLFPFLFLLINTTKYLQAKTQTP